MGAGNLIRKKRLNKQQRLEEISRSIEVLTSHLLFKPSNEISLEANDSKVEIANLKELAIYEAGSYDDLWIWHKSHQYLKKHKDYKRLLKKLQNEADLFSSFSIGNIFLQPNSEGLSKKIVLLEQLVTYSDALSIDYDRSLDAKFSSLERELNIYLTFEDKVTLNASGISKFENFSLVDTYIHKLQREFLYIIRTVILERTRDLRDSFRKMVRFHFKNMNDESDASNLSFKNFFRKKIAFTSNFIRWNINKEFNILKIYLTLSFLVMTKKVHLNVQL
jgi:hypothetical protein